jgi:phosphohistidine phosphatase
MAAHLSREVIAPELVLCSSARRAQETLAGIAPALRDDTPVKVEADLYHASERDLLERLRAIPDAVQSAMLIGHNPAIHALTLNLAGEGAELPSVARKYPTGALATLTFTGTWGDLEPRAAKLAGFVKPKDLS